jgi:hypothetical protein
LSRTGAGLVGRIDPMSLNPPSVELARALLMQLGAPRRLIRHVELVGGGAEILLAKFNELGFPIRAEVVRVGVVLHDAGKILHPAELDGGGNAHEPAGERLLVDHGVSTELARICISHARWAEMPVTPEELLVALADKLWKGVRNAAIEERVVDDVVAILHRDRSATFVELDTLFEEVAATSADRLERSRL